MRKENQLLSGAEYGFGRLAYYDYRFLISQDYQCGIVLSMGRETRKESVSTPFISLQKEEIEKVQKFCEEMEGYRMVGEEDSGKYDGFSVTLTVDGKEQLCIKDNPTLQKKFLAVRDEIRDNHEELSPDRVLS